MTISLYTACMATSATTADHMSFDLEEHIKRPDPVHCCLAQQARSSFTHIIEKHDAPQFRERCDSATLVNAHFLDDTTQIETLVTSLLIAPALAIAALIYMVFVLPVLWLAVFICRQDLDIGVRPLEIIWRKAAAAEPARETVLSGSLMLFSLASPLMAILLAIGAMLAALQIIYSLILAEQTDSVLLKYVANCWRSWARMFVNDKFDGKGEDPVAMYQV
ncbi:hypothetical protein BCR37DRAFT_58984 [Protomyces lactucae-debilis]|uniref:Uncharacterized protein n=1 Tax=Protomyces lactucae-debilis TaxID=2754530 RepID=A0A1Y2FBW4_PROLT|nr:uncharacterized protein BCR37DRAFT_58984 [Protomyces lactucae-debilis]ORY80924.1 hypothetical protein BCR37DRAFT_58984 [Protomyces lactucae-debilis]